MAFTNLKDELTCSICTDIYTDPITLICGHSFCKSCIIQTWNNQEEREYSCPECRERFRLKPELKINCRLHNISVSFKPTCTEQKKIRVKCTYCINNPVPATKTCKLCEASLCENHLKKHSKSAAHTLIEPTTCWWTKKCAIHHKILEFYCSKDATCICLFCIEAGEHLEHQVETLDEALERKKKILIQILEKLTSEREEVDKRIQNLNDHRREVQEKAAGVTERLIALIGDIKEQLEVLEKNVLEEVSRQEEQITLRISELIQQLEIKKEKMSTKICRFTELCSMTNPFMVLQEEELNNTDLPDSEERDIKGKRENGTYFNSLGDLDMRLISANLHPGLTDIVSQLMRQLSVPMEMLLNANMASDILLDVNTAGNFLTISGDLKTVSKSGISQIHEQTQQRFQCHQVLSTRNFSSGRHYWEVKCSKAGDWRIGMAYPSIERKGDQSFLGYNTKSWALEKWQHSKHYSAIHDSKEIKLSLQPSSQRIRVYVDYEAGSLSFYEAGGSIRHLHTFTATFTEPLHAGLGLWNDVVLSV
ncbi:E3 ubiquitin-protein ligase TRIM39-like [Pelobates fuscus]|uniref:E3 ubiquitin-protein ligase TRIM39-like n=1 Tax=Pelobates fuscus TaxID=191477 RepID=UPI002FE4C27A